MLAWPWLTWRPNLRQRLTMVIVGMVAAAIGIGFYVEYSMHRQMIEADISMVEAIARFLLTVVQYRDGQPVVPYSPEQSRSRVRLLNDEQTRFRIAPLPSGEDMASLRRVPSATEVVIQAGGRFPDLPADTSIWQQARANDVWYIAHFVISEQHSLPLSLENWYSQHSSAWQAAPSLLPSASPQSVTSSDRATAAAALWRLDIALEVSQRQARLASYAQRELINLPLTLLVTALLVWWFVERTLRPLAQLTEATQQMQRQRFPEPLAVLSQHDEVGMLTSNFNAMLHVLQNMQGRERSFTRYASHELRTPLSTLKAQLEAVELELPPDQSMPVMKQALGDIEAILAALLQLSRLEAPRRSAFGLAYLLC